MELLESEELFDLEDGKVVSEDTYWQTYYDDEFNYEWVNGRLDEVPVSNYLTFRLYRWLLHLMECYLQLHKIAHLIGLRMGFRVPLPPDSQNKHNKKRVNVRRPDLGVILHSNPVPIKLDDTRYDGIFDLCIEAVADCSKKAKERDTIEKKEEYEYARVKEYYILDGKKRETAFYRLNRWGIYEEIKPILGDVIRSEVLPGFQFRLSDLYQLTPQKNWSKMKSIVALSCFRISNQSRKRSKLYNAPSKQSGKRKKRSKEQKRQKSVWRLC